MTREIYYYDHVIENDLREKLSDFFTKRAESTRPDQETEVQRAYKLLARLCLKKSDVSIKKNLATLFQNVARGELYPVEYWQKLRPDFFFDHEKIDVKAKSGKAQAYIEHQFYKSWQDFLFLSKKLTLSDRQYDPGLKGLSVAFQHVSKHVADLESEYPNIKNEILEAGEDYDHITL